MKITNEVLENAKYGMERLKNNNKNVFIQTQKDNPDCISYMVECGNIYYCGQNESSYVYWDGSRYGFTFFPEIFDKPIPTNKQE